MSAEMALKLVAALLARMPITAPTLSQMPCLTAGFAVMNCSRDCKLLTNGSWTAADAHSCAVAVWEDA